MLGSLHISNSHVILKDVYCTRNSTILVWFISNYLWLTISTPWFIHSRCASIEPLHEKHLIQPDWWGSRCLWSCTLWPNAKSSLCGWHRCKVHMASLTVAAWVGKWPHYAAGKFPAHTGFESKFSERCQWQSLSNWGLMISLHDLLFKIDFDKLLNIVHCLSGQLFHVIHVWWKLWHSELLPDTFFFGKWL